jgi:hypothetical protein
VNKNIFALPPLFVSIGNWKPFPTKIGMVGDSWVSSAGNFCRANPIFGFSFPATAFGSPNGNIGFGSVPLTSLSFFFEGLNWVLSFLVPSEKVGFGFSATSPDLDSLFVAEALPTEQAGFSCSARRHFGITLRCRRCFGVTERKAAFDSAAASLDSVSHAVVEAALALPNDEEALGIMIRIYRTLRIEVKSR